MRYIKVLQGEIIGVINSSMPLSDADLIEIDSLLPDHVIVEQYRYEPNNGLVEDQQKKFRALKLGATYEIKQACKSAIVSGFISNALGSNYFYPLKTTDQQNLAASVLDSYDPENTPAWTTPFWCADASGEWAFRQHTAQQIRQVGREAKATVIALQLKNEQLQAAIAAAETAEEIQAITW